jgi:hypothetical protein
MTDYIWIQSENGATMMARQPAPDPNGLFGKDGPTFKDVVDSINPLQQLPIIGTIYRELTGDTISQGARLIGGTIYGMGVLGAIGAAANNAVETTTGHDAGGTALAMIKGESLHDMMQTAEAKRTGQTQQVAYYAGGADPIDPTSLPAGAKLVDYPAGPAAAIPPKQYAALPTDQPATDLNAVPGVPAAAPTAAVTVAPLPPTIGGANAPLVGATAGLPGHGLASGFSSGQSQTGTGSGGAIPAMPTTPAGLTGMTSISHLPSAGMITPVGPAMTAAATTESLQAAATGSGAASPAIGAAAMAGAPVAAVAAGSVSTSGPAARTADSGAAIGRASDGFFPAPQRTNNVSPRMPVALTPANIGPQPLALTTSERTSLAPVTVTSPAIKASATASAPLPAATTASGATMPSTIDTTGLAPSQIVPPAQVPDAMMRALDKYDALMKSRRNGDQVNHSL